MRWILNLFHRRKPSNDPIAVATRRWRDLPSLKP